MKMHVPESQRAEVLAALHNNAFVNGYMEDGTVCPPELARASLSKDEAREALREHEQPDGSVEIRELNGRWMYLRFSGDSLELAGEAGGASVLYDEHFGQSSARIVELARGNAE